MQVTRTSWSNEISQDLQLNTHPCLLCSSVPMERVLVAKERQAGSYRLSAYYLAASTSDLPLHVIRPLLFIVVTYFASNLARTPENFLGFLMLNIFLAFTMAVSQQSWNVGTVWKITRDPWNRQSFGATDWQHLIQLVTTNFQVLFSWRRQICHLICQDDIYICVV